MTMTSRIQKLEDLLGQRARIVVFSQPRNMSDEELERFLEAKGISTRTDDLIVSLKRLGDGHPEPWVTIDGVQA